MKPSVRLKKVGAQKVRASVATMRSGEKARSKSSGLASSAAKNGCHAATAALRERPWKTIDTWSRLPRRKRICSPQCGPTSARAQKSSVRPISLRNAAAEVAATSMLTAPKVSGSACTRSVSRVTTPKLPPPPPLSAQKRSGFVQALARRTWPSAVTTSASSRLPAAVP